jgi:ABC-type polysaccharide/polyol phosphate transport system ATPase subunit
MLFRGEVGMAIIEINQVTKEFRLGHFQSLKQSALSVVNCLRGKPVEKKRAFKSLDDISLKVEQGEVLGIIGSNGAGKSTLLKLIARISVPTRGEISVCGSIAPLIEVGAGLHPELTGRENIYLNGAIMGIPREVIKRKFDEIVGFAELHEFIDTPVKRYSSGMAIRLGFSIATAVDTNILIVDEVLAVGDLAFQRKCFDRMEDLIKKSGKTVLLVSHNIRQVERICSRVILINQGRITADGSPGMVCNLFFEQSNEKIAHQGMELNQSGRRITRTDEIELESLQLINKDGIPASEVGMGEPVTIRGVYNLFREIENPEIHFGFHTTDFFYISTMGTAHIEKRPNLVIGKNVIECHISNLPLVPGVYCIRAAVIDKFRRDAFNGENLCIFTVRARDVAIARMPSLGVVHLPVKWAFNSDPVMGKAVEPAFCSK